MYTTYSHTIQVTQPQILEINVISAEDLRIRDRPIKKDSIVTVSTDPCNVVSTKAKTELDGSYPLWDHKFDLNLPVNVRHVIVEVFSGDVFVGKASIPVSDFVADYTPAHYVHLLCYRLRDRRGERNAGKASIPVSDFVADYTPAHYVHLLCYRLRDRRGERNGIVNLSIRVKG